MCLCLCMVCGELRCYWKHDAVQGGEMEECCSAKKSRSDDQMCVLFCVWCCAASMFGVVLLTWRANRCWHQSDGH